MSGRKAQQQGATRLGEIDQAVMEKNYEIQEKEKTKEFIEELKEEVTSLVEKKGGKKKKKKKKRRNVLHDEYHDDDEEVENKNVKQLSKSDEFITKELRECIDDENKNMIVGPRLYSNPTQWDVVFTLDVMQAEFVELLAFFPTDYPKSHPVFRFVKNQKPCYKDICGEDGLIALEKIGIKKGSSTFGIKQVLRMLYDSVFELFKKSRSSNRGKRLPGINKINAGVELYDYFKKKMAFIKERQLLFKSNCEMDMFQAEEKKISQVKGEFVMVDKELFQKMHMDIENFRKELFPQMKLEIEKDRKELRSLKNKLQVMELSLNQCVGRKNVEDLEERRNVFQTIDFQRSLRDLDMRMSKSKVHKAISEGLRTDLELKKIIERTCRSLIQKEFDTMDATYRNELSQEVITNIKNDLFFTDVVRRKLSSGEKPEQGFQEARKTKDRIQAFDGLISQSSSAIEQKKTRSQPKEVTKRVSRKKSTKKHAKKSIPFLKEVIVAVIAIVVLIVIVLVG